MANHHKLILIGKLARDPEFKSFSNGGGVAKFGLPVEFKRAKKNPQTGTWEGGESFFINVDVFNQESRKLADLVMQYLKKGSLVYVEGKLKNNEYTDKSGAKISRPVLVADTLQFLDAQGIGGPAPGNGQARPGLPVPTGADNSDFSPHPEREEEIPF